MISSCIRNFAGYQASVAVGTDFEENRMGENIAPVGAVSPSKVVIFTGESLASVGISSPLAVFWFMRKIFEPESKSTLITCFGPFNSKNAIRSGQG